MNSLYLEWDEEAGERVVASSSAVLWPLHIGGENDGTESAEAEAPIEDIGDLLSEVKPADFSEAPYTKMTSSKPSIP